MLNVFLMLGYYASDEIFFLITDFKEASGFTQFLEGTNFPFENELVWKSELSYIEQNYQPLQKMFFKGSFILNMWQLWKFMLFIFLVWIIVLPWNYIEVLQRKFPNFHSNIQRFLFYGLWQRCFMITYLYMWILTLTSFMNNREVNVVSDPILSLIHIWRCRRAI